MGCVLAVRFLVGFVELLVLVDCVVGLCRWVSGLVADLLFCVWCCLILIGVCFVGWVWDMFSCATFVLVVRFGFWLWVLCWLLGFGCVGCVWVCGFCVYLVVL